MSRYALTKKFCAVRQQQQQQQQHHLFIHVTPRSTEDSLKRARAARISTGKLVHLK